MVTAMISGFFLVLAFLATDSSAFTAGGKVVRTFGLGQEPIRVPSTPLKSTATYQTSSAQDAAANVVFRPSDSPDAFDSHKIGSARIHRYSRDEVGGGDGDGDIEYVMWYHGRSKEDTVAEDDDDGKKGILPPLSTGRIGMARSKNGLHWERLSPKEGSLSEDVSGVSLGLNKESWWGFDTSHVGLGQVLLPMSTPAIISEGGVYLMYYMGGDHEERPLSEYMSVASDSIESKEEMMVKGMRMKIGVALSQDGKSWGRIEGEDHTGAVIVPYDLNAENGALGAPRDDDGRILSDAEEELYCGWPEVVVDTSAAKMAGVEKERQGGFTMYYSTMLKDSKEKVIARAVSEDGFRWEKRGVCLRPSEELDIMGCARCHVTRRCVFDEDEMTWAEDDGWIMFYEGVAKDGRHRILRAVSADGGKTWKKDGLVLDVGDEASGAWDCKSVGSPHLLRLDDGSCRMYYTGSGVDGGTAIGVAKGTENGEFTRETAQFTFS